MEGVPGEQGCVGGHGIVGGQVGVIGRDCGIWQCGWHGTGWRRWKLLRLPVLWCIEW